MKSNDKLRVFFPWNESKTRWVARMKLSLGFIDFLKLGHHVIATHEIVAQTGSLKAKGGARARLANPAVSFLSLRGVLTSGGSLDN